MERTGDPVGGDGRAAEEARSLGLLVPADQLPGPGWRVSGERTWVTGELDPDSDKSRRARAAGLVTAWRSFEQAGTGRTAWVEVVPYATAEDAELSRRQSPHYFVGTDRPDEQVVAGSEVDGHQLPGVSELWVYEKSVAGPQGVRVSQYVAGTIDRVLLIASCAGPGAAWSLDDLMDLGAQLADRVRAG
jgi:hypothetical protein